MAIYLWSKNMIFNKYEIILCYEKPYDNNYIWMILDDVIKSIWLTKGKAEKRNDFLKEL